MWVAIRDDKGLLIGLLGAIGLATYGVVAAYQPENEFGRLLAAYGAVFIVGSMAWGIAFDSFRPVGSSGRSMNTAGRVTVDELLTEARRDLERLEPAAAAEAIANGALLVDIRSERQRDRDGLVPGAVFVPRNVLEWRCDPGCLSRDERLADFDRWLILMCDEGYQSSLAAATLQRLGFARATDLAGGFQAWRGAGLPISGPGEASAADQRSGRSPT